MGRPSKLSEKQWAEIERRLLEGESQGKLAREFKVARSAISDRFSDRLKSVKNVAHQLVSAEQSLRALPVSDQLTALSLADELRAISMHLAGAGKYGAATAHRLSGIAHAKVAEIDDAAPLDAESMESMKSVAVLTKMANESATIGLNLLNANKDAVKDLNQKQRPQPQRVLVEVVDASIPDAPT